MFAQLHLETGNPWSARLKAVKSYQQLFHAISHWTQATSIPPVSLCSHCWSLSCSHVLMAISRHMSSCEWEILYPETSKYRINSKTSVPRLKILVQIFVTHTDWSTTFLTTEGISQSQQQQQARKSVRLTVRLWDGLFWWLINTNRLLYGIIFWPRHTRWIFSTQPLDHTAWI